MAAQKIPGVSILLMVLSVLPPAAHGLTQTTLTLVTSPNPSIFGAPVTLTAAVTPTNATGRVTFYDGGTVLGTKPLSGGSTSFLTGLLPSGARKLQAYYAGDSSNSAATSNVVTQAVNAQPSIGLSYASSSGATAAVMADFNGDGVADLAYSGPTVAIMLGKGNGSFQSLPINPAVFGVPAAAGDFNGDGKTDLLIQDIANNLNFLAGNGDGTFQAGVRIIGSVPIAPVVGDFNGDGKLDLAIPGPNGVNILLGNGDGTFQPGVVYPASSSSAAVTTLALGDFNRDGKPDLAAGNGSTVSILLGRGDGTFQAPLNNPAITQPSSLVVADFNQDGKADLVTISTQNKFSIQLGNGDGTFGAPVTSAAGFICGDCSFPFVGAVGDFNGDGRPDLAIGDTFGISLYNISILLGNGDGTFQAPASYQAFSPVTVLISGDFNSDGKTDLFSGSILLGTTMTLTATGGTPQSTPVGTAFPAQLQATLRDGAAPVSGATVFFRAVGIPGAVLSNFTAITDASGIARVTATANGQAGSYTADASFQGLTAFFSLTNTVGPPAILTALSGAPQSAVLGTAFPNALKVKLTDSAGNSAGNPASGVSVTFTAPSGGATAVLSSGTVLTDASGVASVTAAAGSIAGTYTVTANFGSLSTTFSLNNVLQSTVTLAASPNPSTLGAPVTFTATVAPSAATGRVTFYDGVTVLGTRPLSSGAASLTTILLPAGTRKLTAYYSGDAHYLAGTAGFSQTVKSVAAVGFGAESSVNVGSIFPTNVAVGDFNGDGKADLAVPGNDNGLNTVTILLGNGDGTFQPPARYVVAFNATSIAIADFNGDGNSDIAVSASDNQGGGLVSMLLGNGDGTFRPAVNFSAPGGSMAVADFNGDGKPDLVFVGSLPATMLGNGDGTFQAPVTYLASSFYGAAVVVGDFNGDGKPDIVIAGYAVQIALGNGDGTLQPFSNIIDAGSFGSSLAVADFNGDGKLDLVVGLSGSAGSQSVLLGNGDGTFQPPASLPISGSAFVVGDFNGDGIADLAISNPASTTASSTVSLLQGNGDGTFHLVLSHATTGALSDLVVADFNGDGRADLAGDNAGNGTPHGGITILLGVASGVSLTATGGTSQSTVTGAPFPVPLEVTVIQNGNTITGAIVNFTAPSTGASAVLTPSTAVTNTTGIATVNAVANKTPGNYAVTATYQGLTATFSLANTTLAGMVASGGTPQSTFTNTPFPKPLQVTVRDSAGNLASGVTVTFTAPTSGASVLFPLGPLTTDTSGQASVLPFANSIAGSYTVTATAGGLSASFSLTNISVKSITASGGTLQSATVGAPFPNALQVTVRDSAGNPVSNSPVIFSAPPAGASAILTPGGAGASASATTNAAGVASVTATANGIPGAYTVTAGTYTPTGPVSASFSLTNLPSGSGSSNLAFGKLAAQSSTLAGYPNGSAASAVEGRTDGNFSNGSVTATNSEPNAWWQVDLGGSATISSIVIWNRTDCCGARLNDYWVFVSDSPFAPFETPTTLQNRPNTWSSHQTAAPDPSTNIATAATGRFVRVQLSGTNYLSLAEVQVFGTGAPAATNLAPGKAATQSSTLAGYPGSGALSAIDGRTDGNFSNGSVTATNSEANPWWQLDLGAPAIINSILIWNRTDCCSSRLNDYWVFVSDTPFSPTDTPAMLQNRSGTFSSHQTSAPTPSIAIAVSGPGRYVRVQLSGTNYLSLAEVQILGFGGGAAVNLAMGRAASQSSTYPGYPGASAASAVDGSTDGNFSNGSVTATNPETSPWWQLDLGGSTTIDSIVVWNRTDCCSSRLGDYWVFVSDAPFGPTDTPATLQNRPATWSSHQTAAPNSSTTIAAGTTGRYVRVQLTGMDVLSLAEVQVYGIGPAVTDLAVGKSASQSSTLPGNPTAGAASAVDGNTDGNFSDGSVTATNLDTNAWWQVDLGASATISSIVIWNRTDCCTSRLGNFWVFISDTPFSPNDTPATLQNRPGVFGAQPNVGSNPYIIMPSGGAQGRYVRVQLNGANYLSLAEVQVFGSM